MKRLVELRSKQNKTQEDMSKILGVARSTYAMYENGSREMDYKSLVKVADYFRVSLDYLFERTDFPIHIESYSRDEIEFITESLEVYRRTKQKFFS
ncbi:helix-turn-helix domain-containing protein [Halalkalibacterium halodurans]|uniref:helix-turn-helix domain-containing protein n=1 Tax=Halalkalibacterium halodurans TaxID=86665 RepID=UPI002AAA0591|nr:helix-turn-helix transcriptional regulator [Halalkalibacterium halodurans]MDY7222100.1 helix-turn-helix transcriptional regulator [Halalkalibacterium halodurans]MDY7243881.1 helix-turn-helix transcriptional regulator [Halalkalibacterium halodurans]